MNDRLGCFSGMGLLLAGLALLGVLGMTLVGGATLFSPGGLNAAPPRSATLGGVTTHAQLGNDCGACHTSPWSSQTMADRCMRCHTDVQGEIASGTGLHAGLVGQNTSPTCGGCHTEHHGPNGALTALRDFDHSKTQFPLTGKHVRVGCAKCHANTAGAQAFTRAPTTCYGCHAQQDKHQGTFGQDCGKCHNTGGWPDAKFDHAVFPINHGNRSQNSACTTCHPNGLSTYTCFGCHQHTQANVVGEHEGRSLNQLTDCIRCHRGGRREGGG